MTEVSEKALREIGFIAARELPDGTWIAVGRLLFTWALYVRVDMIGYDHRYCFETEADALVALATWDGVEHPNGPWIKRKGNGDILNPKWMKKVAVGV